MNCLLSCVYYQQGQMWGLQDCTGHGGRRLLKHIPSLPLPCSPAVFHLLPLGWG